MGYLNILNVNNVTSRGINREFDFHAKL